MVCKPYAILGCGLVYLHAKFYEDTLSSWSFMCFTIFARMGSKCNQPSPPRFAYRIQIFKDLDKISKRLLILEKSCDTNKLILTK